MRRMDFGRYEKNKAQHGFRPLGEKHCATWVAANMRRTKRNMVFGPYEQNRAQHGLGLDAENKSQRDLGHYRENDA